MLLGQLRPKHTIQGNEREYTNMKNTRTLVKGALILIMALLLSLGCLAAAPQSFFDEVTVGELLTTVCRMHAAYTGDADASTISGENGDYSAVLAYAQTAGILASDPDCSRNATRVDAAKLLYAALPESEYPVINNNIRTVADMTAWSDGYRQTLSLARAGVIDGVDNNGTFEPNRNVTVAELNDLVSRVAFSERRVRNENTVAVEPKQAFRLAITGSMDSYKEGIQSGWEMDNRAGNPRTALNANGAIVDVMTDEKSRAIRHFNRMTDGVIEIRIQLSFAIDFDGSVIELCDTDDTPTYRLVCSDGAFCIQNQDGTLTPIYTPSRKLAELFTFRILIDLNKGLSTTAIGNVEYGTYPLLGDAVKYFAVSTSDETRNLISIGSSYMFSNYFVNENLNLTTEIPFDMKATGNTKVNGDAFDLLQNSTLSKTFDFTSGKITFNFNSYLPAGSSGVSYALLSNGKETAKLTVENSKLYINGTFVKQLSDKLWHKLRIEADPATQTAVCKVNGKVVGQANFLTPADGFDEMVLSNTGEKTVKVDDIELYNLIDYDVPEPVIPDGADNYTIGLNVCPLWVNGEHWGWACVSPFDDIRPVLGYYDEGLPETADWENKFMAEHGIDFQAFCWYANVSTGPMKTTGLSDQLDKAYMHSKYGDKVKFCLLWEAANASHPKDFAAFRDYYVPYWIENYFTDPRYMTINNKLVFSIFGVDSLINDSNFQIKELLDYMREEVKKYGFDGMIITASHTGTNSLAAYGFDGWQAYNWGSEGYQYSTNINNISTVHRNKDVYAIPTVSVGFNDVGWTAERDPLMTVEDYRKSHEWVRDTYLPQYSDERDWSHNLLWLSTWNEYGEGTYIMPSDGLNGFGYLDVLRSVYTNGGEHTDVRPTAEQKARINHLYPQDRRLLRAYGNYVTPSDKAYDDSEQIWSFTSPNAYKNYIELGNMKDVLSTSSNGTTFRTDSLNPDAIFYIKEKVYSGYTCDQIDSIRVVASGIPVGESMQLFYRTTGAPDLSEANSMRVVSTTTDETTYEFKVSTQNGWNGDVIALRLDPLQKTNVTFTVKSISVVPKPYEARPEIYVNSYEVPLHILPEKSDGVWYVPFEPGKNMLHYLLYTYYDWNYDTGVLNLYRDKKCVTFKVGSDSAEVDGTPMTLDGKVYQIDNLPMLPIESLARIFGFTCEKRDGNYYITTPERDLFGQMENEYTDYTWNFNVIGSSAGWNGGNMTIGFGDGSLILTSSNGDPMIYSPSDLDIDCSIFTQIEIRCRWNITGTGNRNLGFYFITDSDGGWNEAKHVTVPIAKTSKDEYRTLTLDMTNSAKWSGVLKQLRFDPFDTTGTIEVDYIRFVRNPDKTLIAANAETSDHSFISDNAEISVTTDPGNASNHVYLVKTKAGRNWAYLRKNCVFEPGKTYQVEFDVKLAGKGSDVTGADPSVSTDVYANIRYLDSKGAIDHINGAQNGSMLARIKVSDGWKHVSFEYTIDANSTDRANDQFTIYSNPLGEEGVSYYIDNLYVMEM
mgnify:FL=1